MAEKLALVGIGKIARDQHIPAIAGNSDWQLEAAVSRHAGVDGIDHFETIDELLENRPDITTVSLAIPPQPRFEYAAKALKAGKHVMLEKPPGQSLAECYALEALAKEHGVTLFATWHSRYADSVPALKAFLAERTLKRLKITWKEDVRRWHPGQEWIWEPGGMGVFDPGINALSILTEILPYPVHITAATLEFPQNRATPIAAALTFADPAGAQMSADFDWRQEGPQTWDIDVETDRGAAKLSLGGERLEIDGEPVIQGSNHEYANLYVRMADLVKSGASDVDLSPMIHVCDAFSLGRRVITDPFEF
ncbi:putative d-galactose 1-dehydrogenase protein [Stappia aggregata IAM 12614]|uniref:Putative d-galactose 1-dehydrogenase protein n=1 Tax=Roseibium aggregatum (strain ATCC 25650 / DSM 13394 / JCM 20685 / NBRC 16684 / NCIMB 2208 / IAM 12614 / B1) TaxID=384765 RepID=A0P247_ROSAI|nr:Gfo/Idh/MocA family oxidoreductase [Roseibium aggregatum]EAV40903.1 putative d-galactose 1-dehydrogenase protein [Stappia aggregata IAM 12614] [Roseibium aggregatum IAM 12614]